VYVLSLLPSPSLHYLFLSYVSAYQHHHFDSHLLADLEIVGTSPNFQRKGAGSKLLQYGCERADEQGVEAFLEAAPDALSLYQKFGFRTAAAMDTLIKYEQSPEGEIYTETFMIREPLKA
jgi:ribosomal protein S18 acetylase RimI-like enzyme